MSPKPESYKPIPGDELPRFAGIATFMRLPYVEDPAGVDIGMIGVPWDGGTTNRAGARHGPRQIRDLSTMVRNVHHKSRIKPFELAKCADLGPLAPGRRGAPRRVARASPRDGAGSRVPDASHGRRVLRAADRRCSLTNLHHYLDRVGTNRKP